MKEGWKIKPFSDICYSIEDGDWIEKKDQSDSGIRLVQTGNIGVGQYRDKADKSKYISEETFMRLRCTEIVAGDVLISRLPEPVGRACILPQLETKCITAVDCSILKLKSAEIDPSWFIYYTQSDAYFSSVRAECSGTTRDRISRKKLSGLTVPVPSLSEQQRIVDILDKEFEKIDRLRSNAEQNLRHAKDLFQAALRKELEPKEGWETITLQEFFDITSSKRVFQSDWKKDGVPFYRAREIVKLSKNGHVDNDLFITPEMYDAYKKKYGVPKIGDILITGVGTLGVCYLVSNNKPFYFKDGNVIWLKKTKEISSEYVVLTFLSDDVQKQVHSTQGAVVGTYTIKKAKSTIISIPKTLQEQEAIVSVLNNLNAKCKVLQDNYTKTIALCDDLKQALLRKAFNGEL